MNTTNDLCPCDQRSCCYAPTEANPNTQLKGEYWKHMFERIPTKECLFVPVDANVRTGWTGVVTVRCMERSDVMSVTITANAC